VVTVIKPKAKYTVHTATKLLFYTPPKKKMEKPKTLITAAYIYFFKICHNSSLQVALVSLPLTSSCTCHVITDYIESIRWRLPAMA
jgi:hypothetical protein